MSQDHSERPFRQHRGIETRLFAAAVLTTLVVFVSGSVMMWGVYKSLAATVAPQTDEVPERALRVQVGRTPGGPREWVTYAAVFSRLQHALGRPVVLTYALSQDHVEENVRAGKVDIALVPISAYLHLERDDAAVLVAAPQIRGLSANRAVLAVRTTSRIRDIRDLESKRLAVTRGSLAGESFVSWRLRSLGESPDGYFASVLTAEAHERTLEYVLSGQADVAAVSQEALRAWPSGQFRVIDRSPDYAMPPVIARADLDPMLTERIRHSLVTMDVESLGRTPHLVVGFVRVRPDDYSFPRSLGSTNGSLASLEPTP